jgi:hypothetical protein
VALAALLLPRLAEACPMCASQQPGGVARIAALGVMMLLPFGIAFVLYRVLRRAAPAADEGSGVRARIDAGGNRVRRLRELKP